MTYYWISYVINHDDSGDWKSLFYDDVLQGVHPFHYIKNRRRDLIGKEFTIALIDYKEITEEEYYIFIATPVQN